MKTLLRSFLVILCLWLCPSLAQAATCFWVGGTAAWDLSNTSSWASTTGGTPGTCAATGGIPKNSIDIATFDASSGSGTVTINTNLSITSIVWGAFTGTLDWSANNNTLGLSGTFNGSGTGTRTLNMGSNTWTLTGTSSPWDYTTVTNLTHNANTSTLNFAPTGAANATFVTGSKSFNVVGWSRAANQSYLSSFSGNPTIATLNLTGPLNFSLGNASTITVTNAFNLNSGGSGTAVVSMRPITPGANIATLSVASGTPTGNFFALQNITCSGGATFSFTNSFDFGGNTTCGITPPSGGGAATGRVIGGWLLKRDLRHDNDNSLAFVAVAA